MIGYQIYAIWLALTLWDKMIPKRPLHYAYMSTLDSRRWRNGKLSNKNLKKIITWLVNKIFSTKFYTIFKQFYWLSLQFVSDQMIPKCSPGLSLTYSLQLYRWTRTVYSNRYTVTLASQQRKFEDSAYIVSSQTKHYTRFTVYYLSILCGTVAPPFNLGVL